eukprot:IDg1296t1
MAVESSQVTFETPAQTLRNKRGVMNVIIGIASLATEITLSLVPWDGRKPLKGDEVTAAMIPPAIAVHKSHRTQCLAHILPEKLRLLASFRVSDAPWSHSWSALAVSAIMAWGVCNQKHATKKSETHFVNTRRVQEESV